MKKNFIYLLTLLSTCVSLVTHASPSLLGAGFSMTTGYVTNPYDLHSVDNNPAGIDFLIDKESTKRLGLVLPNASAQYELGDVSGFTSIKNDLDKLTKATYSSQADVDRAIAKANRLMQELEPGGQVYVSVDINPLLTPIVWRSKGLRGTLSLNFKVEGAVNTRFRSAAISPKITPTANGTVYEFSGGAGMDTRAITLLNTSLGYSTTPFSRFSDSGEAWGRLDLGGRFNLYSANAQRGYLSFTSNDVDQINKLGATASSSQYGLDLGVMNTHQHVQFGLTYYNLGAPTFVFPQLTSAAAQSQAALGQLSLTDKVTFAPQPVVEMSLFNASRSLTLQASHALQASSNLQGQAIQYSTLSAGIYPKFESSFLNVLTPTVRVGYRINKVGSQLDTYSFGFSLFRALNVDLWMSRQQASFDTGNAVPRSAGASIGFTSSF